MHKYLLILLLCCGCSSVAKKMYGIKDPDIENRESIIRYATSINLDTTYICTVDTSAYLKTLIRIQSSLPEAELFNREGVNISYKKQDQDCNAGLFSFIPSLRSDSAYTRKDAYNLTQHLNGIRGLNGETLHNITDPSADYYLFIYWVRWIGKLNKDHVREWMELAKANPHVRIQVIPVNMDFQSWWPESFQQKVTKSMSKRK